MTAPEEYDTPKTKMTLPELRKFDGQLFIQNNTSNYITFHEKMGEKSVDFELEAAGEPDSLAFLPKAALDMRGLQKLLMKGVVSISTDPDMENQIFLLNAQAVGASEQRMREVLGTQTEANTNGQIEEKACLSCGKRNHQTGVIERGRVLQSRRDVQKGIPPLCSEHIHEANFYVPRMVSEKGEDHWEFDKMQLGATLR